MILIKTPIAINIDDGTPYFHIYREHAAKPFTKDGRPLLKTIPNSFLDAFANAVHKYGIRGKLSVVPSPCGHGDIVRGLDGFPREELDAWLETVKRDIVPYFSLCPEMITHHKAVNLADGGFFEENEAQWSQHQTLQTLIPYITYALTLCRDAGLPCGGVTSPWDFGVEVEDDYSAAVGFAMDAVYGKDSCWYFCRSLNHQPNARPWVSKTGEHTVISIPGTIPDYFWDTMNSTDTSDEYISGVADKFISADGSTGEVLDVLNTNGWPILTTHWQSLFSNGSWSGLRVLEEVARRINKHLSDQVAWTSFDKIMELTAAQLH